MNVEERVKALEIGQVQIQKDFSLLMSKQTEMFKQQIASDRTMASVLAKFEAKMEEETQLTLTIRNLDDSVKGLGLRLEGMPMEHNRVVTIATDRLWDSLRKQEAKLQSFKEKVHDDQIKTEVRIKKELVGTAKNYLAGISTVLVICGLLIGTMYFNMKDNVDRNTNHLTKHINNDIENTTRITAP